MKSDLDKLMNEQGIDAIFISGSAQHNPAMTYFVGPVHVSDAFLIKKRGNDPILFHHPMERDEAAKSGYQLVSILNYPIGELIAETGGDFIKAFALRTKKMLQDSGIDSGLVALYGMGEVGLFYSTLTSLQEMLPNVRFMGPFPDEIMLTAMMSKDENEVEQIRNMGKITVDVVGKTADYLTSQKARNGILVHKDDSPVTIGEVKGLINLWLAERGAENPEGTIFAMGRDAAVPHSAGTVTDPLRLGQSIIYDIYPCEAGGGYFYDFTRTWSLGYATDEVQKIYDDTKSVYDTLLLELKVNEPFRNYQARTCDLYEEKGHLTIRTNPKRESGYLHSLGHGVGLRVHEKPWCSEEISTATDILAPGSVFTLEPGLYYPEKGMGVRIEDTLWVTPDGKFEILADYPKDLVLPVKQI